MSIREELLFDFALNMPRVLVTGNTAVLDNVKKVMLLTDSKIVVYNGQKYTSVEGRGFIVTELKEGRMLVSGEVEEIRFFSPSHEDKDRGDKPQQHYQQVHRQRGLVEKSQVEGAAGVHRRGEGR